MSTSLYFVVESVTVFMNKVLGTLTDELIKEYLKAEWMKFKDILTSQQPTQMLFYAQALILTPPAPIVPVATFNIGELNPVIGSNQSNLKSISNLYTSNSDPTKKETMDSYPQIGPPSLVQFENVSNISGILPAKGQQLPKQQKDETAKQPIQQQQIQHYATLGGCSSLSNLRNFNYEKTLQTQHTTIQTISDKIGNNGVSLAHTHFGTSNDKLHHKHNNSSMTNNNIIMNNTINLTPSNVVTTPYKDKLTQNVSYIPIEDAKLPKQNISSIPGTFDIKIKQNNNNNNIPSSNNQSQKSPNVSSPPQTLKSKNNLINQQQYQVTPSKVSPPSTLGVKIASPNFSRPAIASVHVKAQKSLQIDIKEHNISSRQANNIQSGEKDRSTSASARHQNTVGNLNQADLSNSAKGQNLLASNNRSVSFTYVSALEDRGKDGQLQSQKLLQKYQPTTVQAAWPQQQIGQSILPGSQEQVQQQVSSQQSLQKISSQTLNGFEMGSYSGNDGLFTDIYQKSKITSIQQTPVVSSTNVDFHAISASPPSVNLLSSINQASNNSTVQGTQSKTQGKLPTYSINAPYSGLVNSVNIGFAKPKGIFHSSSISALNASHNMTSSHNNASSKQNMTADRSFGLNLKAGAAQTSIAGVTIPKVVTANTSESYGLIDIRGQTSFQQQQQQAGIGMKEQSFGAQLIKTESMLFEQPNDIQDFKLIFEDTDRNAEQKDQQFKRRKSRRETRKLSLENIKPEENSEYFQQFQDIDEQQLSKGKRQVMLNRFDQNLESSLERKNKREHSPVNRRVGVQEITSVRDLGTTNEVENKKVNPFTELIAKITQRINHFKLDSMTLELVAGKLTNIETRLNRTNKASSDENEGGFQERAAGQRANLKRYSVFAKKDGQPPETNQKRVEDTITKDEEITDKVVKSKFAGIQNKNKLQEKKKKLIL